MTIYVCLFSCFIRSPVHHLTYSTETKKQHTPKCNLKSAFYVTCMPLDRARKPEGAHAEKRRTGTCVHRTLSKVLKKENEAFIKSKVLYVCFYGFLKVLGSNLLLFFSQAVLEHSGFKAAWLIKLLYCTNLVGAGGSRLLNCRQLNICCKEQMACWD